jgi:drug/metabolite transporter (DMT)-like permease
MPTSQRSSWLGLYVLLGIVWGSSFLFTKLSLHSWPPFGVVFLRLAIGSLALIAVIAWQRLPVTKNWRHWALMGFGGMFMNTLPFSLFAYAQLNVTSILASIINAATPVMTLLALMLFFRSEKLKPNVILGLLIGMVGILIVLAVWQGFGENDPIAVLAMIGAITCYGIGGPFIMRFVAPLQLPNEVAALGQVGFAAVATLPLYLTGPLTIGEVKIESILAIVVLGAVGSGFAYVWYYKIIKQVGSAIANSVTYITPLVAVVLGILLLGESLHWYEPVGAIVVITGAAISQGRLTRQTFSRMLGRKNLEGSV